MIKKDQYIKYEVLQDFIGTGNNERCTIIQSRVDSTNNIGYISFLFKVGTNPLEVIQALKSLGKRIKFEIAKGYEFEITGKDIEPYEAT